MIRRPTKSLFDAVAGLLGPLLAEYCRIVDEGPDDMPVRIFLGNYEHKTTLATIKDLDRAHHAAFEAKLKKSERKAKGGLFGS